MREARVSLRQDYALHKFIEESPTDVGRDAQQDWVLPAIWQDLESRELKNLHILVGPHSASHF